MKTMRRLDAGGLLVFSALLLFSAIGAAPRRSPVVEEIGNTYGLDSFGQIEAIRYTWNAQFPGVNITHSWLWEPKSGQITYEGKDKDGKPVKVTYVRSQLNSQPDTVKNQVDPSFINDNYWLLFPLHIAWDTGAAVTDEGMQRLPSGKSSAERVVVKYPSEGGYTPGDTWELYVSADKRVEEMVYHRGGPRKPSLVFTTWEGYKKAGPLLISTEHHGTADGKPIRIWLSDVSVKMSGSNAWINAQ